VTVSCVDCLMLVDTAATPANVHVSCRVERRLHVLVDRRNRTVRHHQDEVNRADAEDVLAVRCTLADTALSIILRWTDARASLKARRRSLTRWCLAVLARTRDVCPVLVVDVGLHAWRAAAVVVRQGFVRPFLFVTKSVLESDRSPQLGGHPSRRRRKFATPPRCETDVWKGHAPSYVACAT